MLSMQDLKDQIISLIEDKQLKGYEIVFTPKSGEIPRTFKYNHLPTWFDDGPLRSALNTMSSYPVLVKHCDIRGILVFDDYILEATNGVVDEDGMPKWTRQDKEAIITESINHIPMPLDMFDVMKKTFELVDKHQPTQRYGHHRLHISNRLPKIVVLAQYDNIVNLTESFDNGQIDLRLSAKGTSLSDFVNDHYNAVCQNEQLILTVGHHREPTVIPKPCINGEFIRNMELVKGSLKIHINFEIPLGVSDMMLTHIMKNEVEPLRKEVMEFQQEKYPNVEFHIHTVFI